MNVVDLEGAEVIAGQIACNAPTARLWEELLDWADALEAEAGLAYQAGRTLRAVKLRERASEHRTAAAALWDRMMGGE